MHLCTCTGKVGEPVFRKVKMKNCCKIRDSKTSTFYSISHILSEN